MSNNTDNQSGIALENIPMRVSYTINNEQPVISTYIGANPLFYMDCDDDILEEEFSFSGTELGILENELATLSKEIKTLDNLSADFTRSLEENIDIFMEAKSSILGNGETEKPTLESLLSNLEQSRLAKAYLECATKYGIEIRQTEQVESGVYDRKNGSILVNANLSEAEQTLVLSRELRRHWQHRQGALINPVSFHPDSAILINRAQHADLAASMVRIAWEMQLSGSKRTWQYIENSAFADLGRAFVREAYLDFRTINNGQAATAVFEAWFLSERCRAEDKKLIRQMLADQEGYVFDVENTHAAMTPSFIVALGEMPFGKNYLAIHADAIMTDAIFTEVRDRSNANFLWFIKFERTFRETERDLQSEFSSASGNSAGTPKTQDYSDEEKIITLYERHPARDKDARAETKTYAQAGSNNIVYLRTIPGE
jgi:hypothetical protein